MIYTRKMILIFLSLFLPLYTDLYAQSETAKNISLIVSCHLQRAQELYDQYKLIDAEAEVKKAIDLDKSCAEAYQMLVKIFLGKGTIQGRTEAEWAARQAIKYDPDKADYHITLANIYLDQGFRENAQKYLESIDEKFQDIPEILFLLGKLYQETAKMYHRRVSTRDEALYGENYFKQLRKYGAGSFQARLKHEGSNSIIYLNKYFEKEFQKAIHTYDKLGKLEPHYKDMDRQLALLAYEASNWSGMIEYARDFMKKDGENRHAVLILGLAYLRGGEYEKAEQAFLQFSEKLLPYERTYFEQFDLFLSRDQQIVIDSMKTMERDDFYKDFWFSRDPLFLTEQNERILEHYGRVAEAYLLFSAPKYNMEGWKTDRGLIWIRYGPPGHRYKFPGNEAWHYDTFSFSFYRFPRWSNYVKFLDTRAFSNSEFARQLQKKLPDLFKIKIRGKKIDFPRYAVDFRGRDGLSRVALFHGIPVASLYHKEKDNNYFASVDHGVFLFDHEWDRVVRDVWEEEHVSETVIDSTSTEMLIVQSRMEVAPGEYHLAIEFKDDSSGNIGAVREELQVEEYGYDSLQVSDILLASHIEPNPSAESISIDELQFVPNVSRQFNNHQNLFLYFEIYNLQVSGVPGTSKFRLEYSVQYKKSPDEEEWTIGNILGNLFSFSRNKYDLATSAEYDGNKPVENMYIEIDPAALTPGMYQLKLKVTDQLANIDTQKDAVFYLVE